MFYWLASLGNKCMWDMKQHTRQRLDIHAFFSKHTMLVLRAMLSSRWTLHRWQRACAEGGIRTLPGNPFVCRVALQLLSVEVMKILREQLEIQKQ